MNSRSSLVALVILGAMLAGCKSEGPMSTDHKAPPDPYAGMTKEQKIEAITNDPKLTTMEREGKLAELRKSG